VKANQYLIPHKCPVSKWLLLQHLLKYASVEKLNKIFKGKQIQVSLNTALIDNVKLAPEPIKQNFLRQFSYCVALSFFNSLYIEILNKVL